MTAADREMGEFAQSLGLAAEKAEQLVESMRKVVDSRIQSALADERRKSIDLYRKGPDGIPEPSEGSVGESPALATSSGVGDDTAGGQS